MPHVRLAFVLLSATGETSQDLRHVTAAAGDSHKLSCSVRHLYRESFFLNKDYFFPSIAIYYELCQSGIYPALSTSGTDVLRSFAASL